VQVTRDSLTWHVLAGPTLDVAINSGAEREGSWVVPWIRAPTGALIR
jgi:hypothetical protein